MLLLSLCCYRAQAQCPVNIDFELGSFQNWQCYWGSTASSGGVNIINVLPTAPVQNRHTIIPRGSGNDLFGGFPTTAPDGSSYSVRLGNSGTGNQAEQISYTFTVPANQNNFVLTYQYAVVLEDPQHGAADQPRFTAKVFDLSTNTYITCASFDYVATANLPGFKKSAVSSSVLYKAWTPVAINLQGYQGKQLRLEFTTADCTQGGHFGYAYIDINKSCSNLVSGADYCGSGNSVTLKGPGGFDKYNWYNEDRSKLLGSGSSITLTPAPADGTKINVDLIPFPGFGCTNSASVIIQHHEFSFNTKNPAPVCYPNTIDLTSPQLTTSTGNGIQLSYWKDAAATQPLANPTAVATSGTYYIMATNDVECADIKPVNVIINPLPTLLITNPAPICPGTTADITAAVVTAGSTSAVLTYWADAAASIPLTSPAAITDAGTYYIKATNSNGCSIVKPVTITLYPDPVLALKNPDEVCYPSTVDITSPDLIMLSNQGMRFNYWQDADKTVTLNSPDKIAVSGTYYIEGITVNGCSITRPIKVIVNPLPQLVINNPADVCYPTGVDLSAPAVTAGSTNVNQLSYWKDAQATIPLTKYRNVGDSNMFYIKATSIAGCEIIKPVLVTIHKLPVVVINAPAKVYRPNTVDLTAPAITAGSTPHLTYRYYIDASLSTQITNPAKVNQTGTYYIAGSNQYGCFVVKPVSVTVADDGNILLPKAFTPTQLENNRLYPFLLGIKTFKFLKVYNKWGNMVFQTTDASPEKGWDGYYQGSMHFLETFTWVAEGYDYLDKLVHRSGNTILLK